MNLQSLVVVVLRLMALDFLLRVVIQLTSPILLSVVSYHHSPDDGGLSALPWLVLAAMIVSAVLLWFLALPVARFVTRGVSQDLSFGALSLVDCYTIAFLSVGLFYISRNLPQVLNWSHYLFKLAATSSGGMWQEDVRWYDVSQAFIPFIAGVVLFVNGRGWAVVLARRQAENSAPQTQGERQSE